MKALVLLCACLALPELAVSAAKAPHDAYPTKAVRLIVPYAPGGPADILARLVGRKLAERWGQQVVIDNRGGANGIIAAELAARAAPDGYTMLLGNSGVLTSNPALYSRLPYDAVKDFAPATLIAEAPLLLVSQPALGVTTVAQLIDLARKRPGQLTFASGGAGGVAHLAGELLNHLAGIRTTHVAYKGAAPALSDLIAGQVSFNFTSTVTALPYVKAGKLCGVALTTAKRSASLPDIPTIAETIPGYEVNAWYGILLPAGATTPLVARISTDITAVIHEKDIEQRIVGDGGAPSGISPEEFARIIRDDIAKWKQLARAASLRLD